MYELIQVARRTYYIDCPAKIGVYRLNDTDVCLIDSGNDKDAGKKVRKILSENGWNLRAIVNTHSHADHIGGNKYLQQQTGCLIFAPGTEAAFTKYPIFEPSFLYGGYPCKDLRHKFLLATESDVCDITDPRFPNELEVIPLPGHSMDMIGIRTADDVIFAADCVSSAATLQKYRVTFLYDVGQYLQTLDRIETMHAALFVPAHAEPAASIAELARLNRETVMQICQMLCDILTVPMDSDRVLKEVFDRCALTMNFEQYALVGSTIRSYLAYLKDQGKLTVTFSENQLLWSKV